MTRFRLAAGVADAEALAADRRVQTDFAYRQPGLVRRTTARGDDGTWLVIEQWRAAGDADQAARHRTGDVAVSELVALVDPSSIRVERYTTLD